MDKIILDTSILIKLFSPDEYDKTTQELIVRFSQKRLSFVLVDLAIYEFINALRFGKKATKEFIYNTIIAIFDLNPRTIVLSNELIKATLEIMEKSPLTVYDAVFVAAAELENIPLLTADYRHHKKEISKQIVHYHEWRI